MGIVSRVAETEDQRAGDVEAARDLDGRKQGADLISSENIIDLFIDKTCPKAHVLPTRLSPFCFNIHSLFQPHYSLPLLVQSLP